MAGNAQSFTAGGPVGRNVQVSGGGLNPGAQRFGADGPKAAETGKSKRPARKAKARGRKSRR